MVAGRHDSKMIINTPVKISNLILSLLNTFIKSNKLNFTWNFNII